MSFAIETMMEEHQYILKALKVARQMAKQIVEQGKLEPEDFYKFIDFVRNFADKHHHGKEEEILFKYMENDIGKIAKEGPIRGMLVEHDLGRLYMARLEEALNKYEAGDHEAKLDIIANIVSYTHLLHQHISTEDQTLFPYAQRQLNQEVFERMENEVKEFEQTTENIAVRKKYIALIAELENKYII